MPSAIDASTSSSGAIGLFAPTKPRHVLRAHVDTRTDNEILQAISNPPDVTSEKNVWAWWDTGIMNMRPWCQRNVIGWVRMLGPEWTVRVLDNCENSPCHWSRFLDARNIPACLAERTLHGDHARILCSDMIRLPCLFEHGGVWMDVGIILLMDLDQLCWHRFENKAFTHNIALCSTNAASPSSNFGNFFIAARRDNLFIKRWMQVYLEAWKDRTQAHGLSDHAIFEPLMQTRDVAEDMGSSSAYSLDYFAHLLALDRVRLLQDPSDGFNGQTYCKKHILLLEYSECATAAMLTDNEGAQQFKLLSTRYDNKNTNNNNSGDDDKKDVQSAQKFCNNLLSNSAMIKLYHRQLDADDSPTLADLWDRPENEHADSGPGTFAEYLRGNSVRYAQMREVVPAKFLPIEEGDVIVAGVLEFDDE